MGFAIEGNLVCAGQLNSLPASVVWKSDLENSAPDPITGKLPAKMVQIERVEHVFRLDHEGWAISLLQTEVQFDQRGGITIVHGRAESRARNRGQRESPGCLRFLEKISVPEAAAGEVLSQCSLLAIKPGFKLRLARCLVIADEVLLGRPQDGYLALFSRSETAFKFWDDVLRYSTDQKSLWD